MDRNHLEHIGLKLYWSAFQMKRAYRRAGIWAADLYCREANLDSETLYRRVVAGWSPDTAP